MTTPATGTPSGAVAGLVAARHALLADPGCRGADLRAGLVLAAERHLSALLAEAGGDVAGLALVAVGGYARGEAAPGSDLDLLLVHADRGDRALTEKVARHLWYPLWDSGIGLDCATRSMPEAVGVASSDLKAALGLLDVRHLAGDPELAETLRSAVRLDWRRHARTRLPQLQAMVRDRAAAYGEVAYLLEPHLKESRGGLRDVTALHHLAVAQVADPPTTRVHAGHRLLLDVRGELQRITCQRGNVLRLQEQDRVAAALGMADADELLTAVASAARTVAYASDTTWWRVQRALTPARRRFLGRRPASPDRRPLDAGVVAQDGEVVLARDADPAQDPGLLVRAAAAAADAGLPLSPRALERFGAWPSSTMPWPVGVREAFVRLLAAGAAAVPVLEALDQHDLLVPLLPEWARVRHRPQRNALHRHTVDRHLLETVACAAALTRRVDRPDLLLLAALLHDIGKGQPGDHSEAGAAMVPAITARMGLPAADGGTVATLVRWHLLLAATATRRDLDDPATWQTVIDRIPDRPTLRLLHALTEADGLATGTAAWTPWTANLVDALVDRVAAVLAGDPGPSPPGLTAAQRSLAEQARSHGLVSLDVDESTRHATGSVVVTVAAPDQPGLLAAGAGVCAVHRLDVRHALAATYDGIGLVALTVTSRHGTYPSWSAVGDDLRRALLELGPLRTRLQARDRGYATAALAPAPTVSVHPDASVTATVLEVHARDLPGLLFRLADAISGCGVHLRSARVTSLGADAVNAFYLAAPCGGALSQADQERVRSAVTAAAAPAAGCHRPHGDR